MLCVVLLAPRFLLDWDLAGHRYPADRAQAVNAVRSTLLQGLAGLALIVGVALTWRQVQVTRQGQITDRFTAAVAQIGEQTTEVRIGGRRRRHHDLARGIRAVECRRQAGKPRVTSKAAELLRASADLDLDADASQPLAIRHPDGIAIENMPSGPTTYKQALIRRYDASRQSFPATDRAD